MRETLSGVGAILSQLKDWGSSIISNVLPQVVSKKTFVGVALTKGDKKFVFAGDAVIDGLKGRENESGGRNGCRIGCRGSRGC